MAKLHKSGCFQKRRIGLVIISCPTYYFFPSVCRAMHLCPAATASSTSFWEAFENTSVSSFQKLFSVWEYLWIPFDIITYIVVWSAPAHTCGVIVSLCLFLPDPHLKQCRWINVFCDGLKSYESDVSAWEKAALGKALLFLMIIVVSPREQNKSIPVFIFTHHLLCG